MQSDAVIRALDVCIQKMQSGEKLEQALELYPQWAPELTPPLEAVQVLRVYADSLQNTAPNFQAGRENFIQSTIESNPKKSQSGTGRGWGVRLGWLLVILLILCAAGWAASTAYTSFTGNSLPIRDWLHQARLAVTPKLEQRLAIERQYDAERLQDAWNLVDRGQPATLRFAGLLLQRSPDTWLVDGLQVQLSPQSQVIGNVRDGIWVEVDGELLADQTILVRQIRPREYKFRGALEKIAPDSLLISGIPIQLGDETLVHGAPMAGSPVTVIALRTQDDRWLARLVEATGQE
jgi:hypothetical protein